MTCIVGVKDKDNIYLGADSAINDINLIHTMVDTKVWKKGQFIFGYAGTLRVGQLIKYKMKIHPVSVEYRGQEDVVRLFRIIY